LQIYFIFCLTQIQKFINKQYCKFFVGNYILVSLFIDKIYAIKFTLLQLNQRHTQLHYQYRFD
jgi:hypothetical protein